MHGKRTANVPVMSHLKKRQCRFPFQNEQPFKRLAGVPSMLMSLQPQDCCLFFPALRS